jgi:hypothetical protein
LTTIFKGEIKGKYKNGKGELYRIKGGDSGKNPIKEENLDSI